ncbi:MAG: wax ester/triacylglycerol synthase family O-acyltransferase [Burkholderiales bacterium]|nr:wax ester/triacylglycerol synthase family O-acyltransferase [Burkholderiales bacterium]
MRQLSKNDALFLSSESAHSSSNVSLIQIYDPSTAPGGRLRFKDFLSLVESRLHRSHVFRHKLQTVPLGLDEPYWVEDENFDLEYHVRNIALPKPGDWRQFCIQASRIHARPLDLNRPLWEIYVIEGLDAIDDLPKDSFALLTKLHNAAIDVRRGTAIITLLHDIVPQAPKPEPTEPWFPASPPSPLELACRGLARTVTSPRRLAGPVWEALTHALPAARSFATELLQGPETLPLTRFNAIVSPYRVFETRRFQLDEFREIRRLVPGAKINDVVLAVCAGGLRAYLDRNEELPESDLSTLLPVYLREPEAGAGSRPEVQWERIMLGVTIADPLQRLAFIRAQTAASTLMSRAVGARELTDIGTHAPAATLAITGKMLGRALLGVGRRAPLANCAITNVPGPSVPIYLNGARMTYFSAVMPINDGLGLVFAVTSYDGKVIVSPTSCREQMPDPEVFAQCLRDCFQDYLALARQAARAKARAKDRARPARSATSAGKAARKTPAAARTAASRPRAAPAGRRRSTAPAD